MEEFKIPELIFRSINIKTNISLSSQTQGVQNIIFSEVLSSLNGNQIVQNLGTQGGNISLEFLSLPNTTIKVLENQKLNENNPIDKDTPSLKSDFSKPSSTFIFSEYLPQKPVELKDDNLNFELLPQKENIEKLSQKSQKSQKSKNIKETNNDENNFIKISDNKINNEEKNIKNILQNDIENINLRKNLISPDNKLLDNDEESKRRKRQFFENSKQSKKSVTKNLLDFEILKIIEQYNLEKPSFELSNVNINSREYISWIKEIFTQAKTKDMNALDSSKLSKYIISPHKISYADKEIFQQMISNVFNKKMTSISQDFTVSLEKPSLELMYKILPENMFEGFIKKTFVHSQKRKDRKTVSSAVNKLINGVSLTEKEASILSKSFKDDFTKENLEIVKDMFKGNYEKYTIEKIHEIVSKLHYKKNMPSGFVGSLYEIFFDSMENGQKQTSKQILRFLETYSKGKDFDEGEAKVISKIISTKYFNEKGLNNNKISQIFSNIISKKEIEYFSLDLISQISKKNIINYIPSKIDKDVKDYLKFLPISNKNESISLDSEFILGGKVKVIGVKSDIIKNPILTINSFSSDEKLLIKLDSDFYFTDVLKKGKYQIIGLSFFIGESIKTFDFREKRLRNDINFLDFSLENLEIDIFYFGSLKISISQKNSSILKIEIKNDYKSFLEYRKNKLNCKENTKKIKVNPKLFKLKSKD